MDLLSNIDWPTVGTTLTAIASALGLGAGARVAKRKWDEKQAIDQELQEEGIADAVAEEWRELAHVRGDKIEDLQEQIRDLETRIARLEGAYEALEALKSDDIARRVVEALRAQEGLGL